MATIGWIKVGAAVDTSLFKKGMDDMTSMTEKFKGTMEGLKGLLEVIGITLGVRELSRWIGEAIHGTAEVKNLADRIGLTTEQLQKMSYAAKLSGIDQASLTTYLGKLSENLAEVAITRAGPAADALRRLGLRAKELTLLSPAEAFTKVVAALDQIPNAMEKVKIAKEIFGKSGEGMVSLALQGTERLKEMGMAATATGVALSAIDNAKLAEADDKMTELGMGISGVANQISVVLAPYITAVSDQFIAWMTTGVKTGSVIAQAMDWITVAIMGIADAAQIIQIVFTSLRSFVSQVVSWASQLIDALVYGFADILKMITGIEIKTTALFDTFAAEMEKESTKDIGKAMDLMGKKWAHNTVRELKNEIDLGAQKRAEFAAGKQGLGAEGGQRIKPALVKTGFAGAQQAGSAAAYSSIVQARARIMDSRQDIIAKSSTKTAENTTKMAMHLAMLAGAKNQRVDGAQFREQVSGR